MSLLKYIERLKRMDDLIKRKATGCPDEFADKLGISKSMLMLNLAELKEMGALIRYDSNRKTYFYEQGCRLKFEFGIPNDDLVNIKGGCNFSYSIGAFRGEL
jgi:hypothetical protein